MKMPPPAAPASRPTAGPGVRAELAAQNDIKFPLDDN